MSTLDKGLKVGPYVIEKVLPEGGFAQIVVARRRTGDALKERVALKIARTRIRARDRTQAAELLDIYNRAIQNEVETLRQLQHPGVVRIFPIPLDRRRLSYMARATEIAGRPWYFAMEYLAGSSVERLLQRRVSLSISLVVEMVQQVCAALDYVHAKGFAHLDIKAGNILLRGRRHAGARPEVVLVDFGAAQRALRRAEVEAGAVLYLPPERVLVMRGDAPPESIVDKAAADVYSLGIVFYRMLTGRMPFSGRRSHVTTAILRDTPTRPSKYNSILRQSKGLDDLILAMLEKQPARRPRMSEVLSRLDQLVPPPRFAIDTLQGADASYSETNRGTWKHFALGVLSTILIGGLGVGASHVFSPPPSRRPTATSTMMVQRTEQTPVGGGTAILAPSSTSTLARVRRVATITPTASEPMAPTHTPVPPTATPVPTFTSTPTPRQPSTLTPTSTATAQGG